MTKELLSYSEWKKGFRTHLGWKRDSMLYCNVLSPVINIKGFRHLHTIPYLPFIYEKIER